MNTNTVNTVNSQVNQAGLNLTFTTSTLSGADVVTFVARADTKGNKQGETVRASIPSTYSINDLSEQQKQELLELSLRAAFVDMVREQVKEAKPDGLYSGDSLTIQPINAIDIYQWLTEKAERTAPYKPTKESIASLVTSIMPYAEASFMASRGLESMPAGASAKMMQAYMQVFSTLVTKAPNNDILEKLQTLFALVAESGDTELVANKDYQYFSKRVNKLLSSTSDNLDDFI
jgi:hypothetical protein